MSSGEEFIDMDNYSDCKSQFTDLELVGKGSFGEVYRGKYADGREGDIAIKLFYIEDIESLDDEIVDGIYDALVGAYLHSVKCNVANVREVLRCEGLEYSLGVVMDYLPLSLQTWHTNRCGECKITVKYEICKGIIEAVSCLHDHKIFHRDIKPDNVMLDATLNVKLIDFGLACAIYSPEFLKYVKSRVDKSTSTDISYIICRQGMMGSPLYLPPEEILENVKGNKVTGRDFLIKKDAYAMGVVLYEICQLGCQKLFPDVNSIEDLKKMYLKMMESGEKLLVTHNSIPPALKNTINGLLDFDMGKRWSPKQAVEYLVESENSTVDFLMTQMTL